MLWSTAPQAWSGVGRRVVPPTGPAPEPQPGRERPRPVPGEVAPPSSRGVAHVPAANVTIATDSARGTVVRSTRDLRPRSTAPVVTRTASLSGGQRRFVSA